MRNFEGAEITIYTQEGEQLSFELSKMQTYTALKILGFKVEKGSSYSFFSDQTLQQFFNLKGNPLRLVEKDQD